MALDKKLIGRKFPSSTFEVSKEMIRRYCKAVGEFDPVFKTGETSPPTFASCFFIPSMISAMDELSNLVDPGLIARIVQGEQEYQFHETIRPGTYTLDGKIADLSEKEGRSGKIDVLTLETTAKNEKGEVSVVGRATLLIRRP
nr:MaoC family dehydratase N-terminal domain-containing protein [Candidatus Njordarchaeota archaeon]